MTATEAPADGTELKDDTALMIRRTFDADIHRLWKALTDPKAWMHWFGANIATPQNTGADLRVGGRWFIEMTGNETGEGHSMGGEFTEVEAPNRVSFTWAWYSKPDAVSQVTYALRDIGDGRTTLTLTHERFASVELRDGHNRGWSGSMDNLAAYLAANPE